MNQDTIELKPVITLEAYITHADGTIEDFGVIASTEQPSITDEKETN